MHTEILTNTGFGVYTFGAIAILEIYEGIKEIEKIINVKDRLK